jgi:SAM-dependent methyltransferase
MSEQPSAEKRTGPQTDSFPDLTIDFPAYLEAKFAIDAASLNRELYTMFCDHLKGKVDPRVLDLGTGTGAMLRRILSLNLKGQVHLVGIDQDQESLTAALDRTEKSLRGGGFRVKGKVADGRMIQIRAGKQNVELRIDLIQGDLLDWRKIEQIGGHTFDCITAHAFMDLMPLKSALEGIQHLLKSEGLFYSTLNYDGDTVLLPQYGEPGFEQRLLHVYNRSMESRRTRGRKTGGCLSGRRLYQALYEEGWAILGMGSSDWNLFPAGGRYSADEKLFLVSILTMIAREALEGRSPRAAAGGARSGVVYEKALADWHRRRIEAVQTGRLALVVHQLDLLAAVSHRKRS